MTTGWRTVLWIVLGASLLANAATLGLILRLGAMREAAEFAGLGEGWSAVPAAARSVFREELAENRADVSVLLRELRQAREAMYAAAVARPFDREAVETAQTNVRIATSALQVKVQGLMLEAFSAAAGKAP